MNKINKLQHITICFDIAELANDFVFNRYILIKYIILSKDIH